MDDIAVDRFPDQQPMEEQPPVEEEPAVRQGPYTSAERLIQALQIGQYTEANSKEKQRILCYSIAFKIEQQDVARIAEVMASSCFAKNYWFQLATGSGDWAPIMEAMRSTDVVHTVSFRNSRLGCDKGTAVAHFLRNNSTLTSLDLSQYVSSYSTFCHSKPKISEECLELILEALADNSHLTKLFLSGTSINTKCAKAVGELLKHDRCVLQHLSMASSNLDGTSIIEVAKGLSHNQSLMDLVLKGNKLSDKGCSQVIEALQGHSKLISLDMEDTQLGNLACNSIVKLFMTEAPAEPAIRRWSTRRASKSVKPFVTQLCTFNLRNNNFSVEGAEQIERAIGGSICKVQLFLTDTDVKMRKSIIRKVENCRNQYKELYCNNILTSRFKWSQGCVMFLGPRKSGKTTTLRSLLEAAFSENEVLQTDKPDVSVSQLVVDTSRRLWRKSKSTYGATQSAAYVENSELSKILADEDIEANLAHLMAVNLFQEDEYQDELASHRVEEATNDVLAAAKLSKSTKEEEQIVAKLPTEEIVTEEPEPLTGSAINKFDPIRIALAKATSEIVPVKSIEFTTDVNFRELYQLLLLRRNSIYIYVFSWEDWEVAQGEDNTTMKEIKYWLRVLHFYKVQPDNVRLVGTHAKSKGDGMEESQKEREEDFKKQLLQKLSKGGDFEIDFGSYFLLRKHCVLTIDNKNKTRRRHDDFRRKVSKQIQKQASINDEIPGYWVGCLKKMKQADSKMMPFDEVEAILAEKAYPVKIQKKEVEQMLKFFHHAGEVTYFAEATEILKEFVVLDPEWLLSQLLLVLDPKIQLGQREDKASPDIWKEELTLFLCDGILSQGLLEELLKPATPVETAYFTHLLLASLMLVPYSPKYNEAAYLVPHKIPETQQEPVSSELEDGEVQFTIKFPDGFLPKGVFEQIACLLLVDNYAEKSQICKQFAKVYIYSTSTGNMQREMERDHGAKVPGSSPIETYCEENKIGAPDWIVTILKTDESVKFIVNETYVEETLRRVKRVLVKVESCLLDSLCFIEDPLYYTWYMHGFFASFEELMRSNGFWKEGEDTAKHNTT